MEALLAEDRTVAGVVRIDAAAAAAAYPEIASLPFFGPLLGAVRQHPGRDGGPGLEAIRAADPGRRGALIDQQVRSRVAGILGLPADRVPPDLPLADAGMDSLAAVRIGNLIEHDLAVAIDPASLLGGTTLAGLQRLVALALDGASPPDPAAAGPRVPPHAGWPGDGARPPSYRSPSSSAVPEAAEPRDAAERQVARVAAAVLGAGPAGVTDSLLPLGLTQAARAEIAARLAAETGRPVTAAGLWAGGPTVEAAAETIRRADEEEASATVRTLRLGESPAPPLLLAHPAGGTTGVYKMLADLLGGPTPVFGLERVDGEVPDRAARYAAAIRDRWAGVVVLGGWSFGGALAYETARQLAAAGAAPALVVLLDAALPLAIPPGADDAVLARRFTAFADYLTRTYGRPVELTEEELLGLGEDAQYALVQERMTKAGLARQLSPAILRHQETSHQDTRALERYAAGPYDGPVVLYRADEQTPWAVRDPRYEITDETRGWARLCRDLQVRPVTAHHLNLLDPPAVEAIATHLRTVLPTQAQGGPHDRTH
jgi:phthiocerol/phenolphthiocerol synthesis type-I polyketide synthase D